MEEREKNPHAVELGKLGGQKIAERGPEYYAAISAMRKERKGGRPRLPPKAEYEGELRLDDGRLSIPCAIVRGDDGQPLRLLSERDFVSALDLYRSGRVHNQSRENLESTGAVLPYFLAFPKLKPFIDNDLQSALLSPVWYRSKDGGSTAKGTDARMIRQICEVWLKAREAGALIGPRQLQVAQRAEILIRALADVGIVALVDEATGFQYLRDRQALEKILNDFIKDELGKWARQFPDPFYRELFRLRGWQYSPVSVKRPIQVAKDTINLVYDRLAPGVRQELERKNPKLPSGRRKHKHHQWLTEDIGHPKLREHIASVVTLMKASDRWEQFKKMLDRVLPKYKPLPLLDPLDKPEVEQT